MRADDGSEGAPAGGAQGGGEGGPVAVGEGRADDGVGLGEGRVEVWVVFYGVAEVEDDGFGGHDWGGWVTW